MYIYFYLCLLQVQTTSATRLPTCPTPQATPRVSYLRAVVTMTTTITLTTGRQGVLPPHTEICQGKISTWISVVFLVVTEACFEALRHWPL